MTISYVSREFNIKITKRVGDWIGDSPVLIVKVLVIKEAIRSGIHLGTSKIIVESDPPWLFKLFFFFPKPNYEND